MTVENIVDRLGDYRDQRKSLEEREDKLKDELERRLHEGELGFQFGEKGELAGEQSTVNVYYREYMSIRDKVQLEKTARELGVYDRVVKLNKSNLRSLIDSNDGIGQKLADFVERENRAVMRVSRNE